MKLALAIARDLQIYIYNVTVVKLGTYDLIHQGDFHNNYEFPIMDAFVARERETDGNPILLQMLHITGN